MNEITLPILSIHIISAIILFFLVNWIGKHSIEFGYVSTSLFEEANESLALNFFIRALSPAVFTILISVAFVSIGYPNLRIGIVFVALYYYLIRAGVIFLFNRHRLISWPRYLGHAAIGICAAILAYKYLILPNRSLIPDLNTAGNELWLALLAFLYSVANKVSLSNGPSVRRRNDFVKNHYFLARQKFSEMINAKVKDNLIKLIIYSIIVYEDYCRPPALRAIERLIWWKRNRTTGIMQVSSELALSDEESVVKGVGIILNSWKNNTKEEVYWQVRNTISDYNKDEGYISRVFEVMKIITERADPSFKKTYNRIFSE